MELSHNLVAVRTCVYLIPLHKTVFQPCSLTLHPLTDVHEHPQHQGMLVLKESYICHLQSRQGLLKEEGEGSRGEGRRGVSGSDLVVGELVVVRVTVLV